MNYQEGKIYAIKSNLTEKIYIGSTCRTLDKRFTEHKNERNRSKEIFAFGDAYIELLEAFPCNNAIELKKREGELIKINNCVNRKIEGRTDKEYYEDNKEKRLKQIKAYDAVNKEKKKEYARQYYLKHRKVE